MSTTTEMPAVVFGDDGREHTRDVPIPSAGQGEVLVQVDYCGICGSDLHARAPEYRFGVVMGHEFAGEIVEVGPHVTGWQVGDRACVNPNGEWCGTCVHCQAGHYNMCPGILPNVVGIARNGGMARYATVPVRTLHRLPESVSTKQGAWVEPAAVAIRTVRTSGIKVGDPAVVFGGGPIGLLVICMLRWAGAGNITAIEPSPFRRRLAGTCGADEVIDPRSEDVVERFADPLVAPNHAFDCTGVPTVVDTALQVLAPHGRLTVTGLAQDHPSYNAELLVLKELEIRGSFIYVDEFEMAIDLLGRGAIDVDVLTTKVRPVASALDSFMAMRNGDEALKILLRDW